MGGAVRVDPDEIGRDWWRAAVEIEPEVADVGPAVGIDHHVVTVPRRQLGQIGNLGESPVREAEQLSIVHRDDEQTAFRIPTESRRSVLDRDDLGQHTGRSQREDPSRMLVREEQLAVVPARSFRKPKPFNQYRCAVLRHSPSLTPARATCDRRRRYRAIAPKRPL